MQPRFQTALAQLTAPLQTALGPALANRHFPAHLTAAQVAAIKSQTGLTDEALMLALLPLAAACARADLSHFHVGAIACGVSGNWYFGANMEFLATGMQQTVHAEQSAIVHAWMLGEAKLVGIAVNCTLCGHCRQFMSELNSGLDLLIYLPDRGPLTLGDYLPHAFGPRDLGIHICLLDREDHGFVVTGDALSQAAIVAANRSHAPYSKAPAAVALQTRSGQIFAGSYAENAAFNPSLPPLQVALNLLSLNGFGYADIQRAVLVEAAVAAVAHWQPTLQVLQAIGCQSVERMILSCAWPG